MYADQITNSMDKAIKESNRRRDMQLYYNKINNIVPKSITKKVDLNMNTIYKLDINEDNFLNDLKIQPHEIGGKIDELRLQMKELSNNLKFEEAASLRDKIKKLKKLELSFLSKIE